MLQKVEEKLSKIKLKITGDISLEALDECPQFSQRVLEVVDSKKIKIAEILAMSEEPEISIKELGVDDSTQVLDFFVHSTKNHGPFAQAIRSKCDTEEKVRYELGPWEDIKKYHNLYFGCYLKDPHSGDIMIGGIVAGVLPESGEIEIGGLTRNDSKGKGFGTSSVLQVVDILKRYNQEKNLGIKRITSVVSDHTNLAARRMLEKAGFYYVKSGQDGILYAYFLEQ